MRALLLALMIMLMPVAAEGSVLRAVRRAVLFPVKVVKRVAGLPEYVLMYEAEAIAAWWRYEVCER